MPAWLTVVLGTALTVAPQFIAALPAEVGNLATAVMAMATSIYHLYQPSPIAPVKG